MLKVLALQFYGLLRSNTILFACDFSADTSALILGCIIIDCLTAGFLYFAFNSCMNCSRVVSLGLCSLKTCCTMGLPSSFEGFSWFGDSFRMVAVPVYSSLILWKADWHTELACLDSWMSSLLRVRTTIYLEGCMSMIMSSSLWGTGVREFDNGCLLYCMCPVPPSVSLLRGECDAFLDRISTLTSLESSKNCI